MTPRNRLRAVFRWLFKCLSHLEATGLENVARQGGLLVATNHLGRLDAPLIFALVDRDDITAMVADKYKDHAFFSWLVRMVNGIWLNREESDIHALRAARDHLQAGGCLGIAPEGTRSPTGALLQAKTGVAFLADKANVPIVPAAMWGTEDAFEVLYRLRKPRMFIRFGPAFTLPALERERRDEMLRSNTDEIMCRIAAMLPEKYRGVYHDHPRLAEILQEKPD
ncbi:MAG: 1-acyl-sn-glycerol-3-phosphate acyltransferase [Chloroflexi bacterium]|nr:1-acyl-sn-glycerol-3-phosphate acyltransferase [Chloroflexota bacterium]